MAGRKANPKRRMTVACRVKPETKARLEQLKEQGFNLGRWLDEQLNDQQPAPKQRIVLDDFISPRIKKCLEQIAAKQNSPLDKFVEDHLDKWMRDYLTR